MGINDPLPERDSWLDPGDHFVEREELDKNDEVCGNCTNFSETEDAGGCGWCTVPIPMWADYDEGGVHRTLDASDCSLFRNKWKRHGT